MTVLRETPVRPAARDAEVAADVRDIVEAVLRGDGLQVIRRLDGLTVESADALRVPAEEIDAALAALDPEVRAGLELAAANVGALVEAQLRDPVDVTLGQGQQIRVDELPVARAGVYAPGGRAAYPSTVVMCAVTARAAGRGARSWCARRPARTATPTRWCWPRARCAASTRSTGWAAPRPSRPWRTGSGRWSPWT